MPTKDFDKEIAKRQQEIAELEAEKAAFAALGPDHQLALVLHDLLCTWNHTDGCGWYYEVHNGIDDWGGLSHERYLKQARELRKTLPSEYDNDTIINVVRAIKRF